MGDRRDTMDQIIGVFILIFLEKRARSIAVGVISQWAASVFVMVNSCDVLAYNYTEYRIPNNDT